MTNNTYTVRAAGPDDASDLAHPIQTCGLFAPEEAERFLGQLPDLLANPANVWLRLDRGDAIVGAAYMSLDGLSEDVWNLWFIGLDPAHHGQGGGQVLLQAAEAQAKGARLMLIETSNDPDQAPARRFYTAAGYIHTATLPDYYADGIDKVVFLKRL